MLVGCVCVFFGKEPCSLGVCTLSWCKIMGIRTERGSYWVVSAVFRLWSKIKWLTFLQDLLGLWRDDCFEMLLLPLIYFYSVSVFWAWSIAVSHWLSLSLCSTSVYYLHHTSQWFVRYCFRLCFCFSRVTQLGSDRITCLLWMTLLAGKTKSGVRIFSDPQNPSVGEKNVSFCYCSLKFNECFSHPDLELCVVYRFEI